MSEEQDANGSVTEHGHKSNEDCMICNECGQCREDLDDTDTCGDCNRAEEAATK